MVAKCSICISHFKDPVCLPCGHLYCKNCLTEHVNFPSNRGMTSTCPDCRTPFHIAIPDLTYLPEKYHPFISHAVRRVYVDLKADSTLQKKLKDAEERLATKKKGEEALLRRCEGLQATLEAHRMGEREANERVEELEERLEDVESDYQSYIHKTNARVGILEEDNDAYRANQRNMLAQLEDVTKQLEYSEAQRRALERKLYVRHGDSDDSDGIMSQQQHPSSRNQSREIPRERVIKPLPRRRVPRHREDDTVTVCSSKRARMYVQKAPSEVAEW